LDYIVLFLAILSATGLQIIMGIPASRHRRKDRLQSSTALPTGVYELRLPHSYIKADIVSLAVFTPLLFIFCISLGSPGVYYIGILYIFIYIHGFIESHGLTKAISVNGHNLIIERIFLAPLHVSIDDIDYVHLRTGYYTAYSQGKRIFKVNSMMLGAERLLRLLSERGKVDADKDIIKNTIKIRFQSYGVVFIVLLSAFFLWLVYMEATRSIGLENSTLLLFFNINLQLYLIVFGSILVASTIYCIKVFSCQVKVSNSHITISSAFGKSQSYPLASVTVVFHSNIGILVDFLVDGKRVVRLKHFPIGFETIIRRLSESCADFFVSNNRVLADDVLDRTNGSR